MLALLLACASPPLPTLASAPVPSTVAAVPAAAPVAPPAAAPAAAPPAAAPHEALPPAFATPPAPPAALGAVYVDKGVCPGECCQYGAWSATRPTPVVAAPGSTEVRATLAAGEKVTAVTGEVHTAPIPARVLVDRALGGEKAPAKVARGDTVWVLTPTGEGYARIWVNGRIVEEEARFLANDDCHRPTPADAEACWAVADAVPLHADPWWVKVRTAAGVVGWVDQTEDPLTGFDTCG